MATIASLLFRVAITVVWSLVLSKLIRTVVWPLLKTLWVKRPSIAFTWR